MNWLDKLWRWLTWELNPKSKEDKWAYTKCVLCDKEKSEVSETTYKYGGRKYHQHCIVDAILDLRKEMGINHP